MTASLTFGSLSIQSAHGGAFQVLQTAGDRTGTPVVRIEVERTHMPKLKLRRIRASKRAAAKGPDAKGRVVLERWQDCELYAHGARDEVEIVLTGHCGPGLFHWRAEVLIIDGEVVVHGPFLMSDPHF